MTTGAAAFCVSKHAIPQRSKGEKECVVNTHTKDRTYDDQASIFDTPGAARFLKLAPITLREWRRQGRGPKFYKTENGSVRYLRSELLAYLTGEPQTLTANVTP